jgi:hypothetical protein
MDWKLTRDAIGRPAIDTFHVDPDEDLRRGYSLMRELAEADEQAEEIAPGIYVFRKSSDERMI